MTSENRRRFLRDVGEKLLNLSDEELQNRYNNLFNPFHNVEMYVSHIDQMLHENYDMVFENVMNHFDYLTEDLTHELKLDTKYLELENKMRKLLKEIRKRNK